MYKRFSSLILCLFLALGSWSCTQIEYASPDPISNYKLIFSKVGKLTQMRIGLYGMGYTTDGKNIYAVNGSSRGTLIRPRPITINSIQRPITVNGIHRTINKINASNVLMKYDVSADKWSVNPITLKPKRFNSAEYVNGKIYVFNGFDAIFGGGTSNRVFNKNVEVFDINTENVNYLSDNPHPVYYSGSAVWNDKIYVFGGTTSQNIFSNKLFRYDPVTNIWTKLADLPEYKQVRGEIIKGILYIFGGFTGLALKSVHAYDIANDVWTYIGEMPISISANAITKHGDFIWLIGDYQKLNTVAVFNTKTGGFHVIKSNMSGRQHAGAEIIGNKLYVFGGNRASSGSFLSSIQSADISEIEKLLSSSERSLSGDE